MYNEGFGKQNKFKADTGADYGEDDDNSPKNYPLPNKKNINHVNDRFTVTNWNNTSNNNFLPQISIRTNYENENQPKKGTKNYYH